MIPVLLEPQSTQCADRHFDFWRAPRTEKAQALVADVINQLQHYESYFRLRKRARCRQDQQTFEATVGAIVCDLAHLHLTGTHPAITITRSNRRLGRKSRYRAPAENKKLPTILNMMASTEMDFLTQKLGMRGAGDHWKQTTIRPGNRLITRIANHRIELQDLGRDPYEEIIILRSQKEGHWDTGEWIEYDESAETAQYRKQLKELNRGLEVADIEFDDLVQNDERFVDTSARRLTRRFTNGSFGCGGRLFGGFWQQLKPKDRREGLQIEGESVAEFDYGQMIVRMLYGIAGQIPPMGDLYHLPGVDPSTRDGIKTLINAMLFSEKALARKPRGLKESLEGQSISEWRRVVFSAHPGLVDYFEKGLGHKLQFMESEVLVALLLRLKREGIVALPMHDGVIVKASARRRTKQLMEQVFEQMVGLPAIVREDY